MNPRTETPEPKSPEVYTQQEQEKDWTDGLPTELAELLRKEKKRITSEWRFVKELDEIRNRL